MGLIDNLKAKAGTALSNFKAEQAEKSKHDQEIREYEKQERYKADREFAKEKVKIQLQADIERQRKIAQERASGIKRAPGGLNTNALLGAGYAPGQMQGARQASGFNFNPSALDRHFGAQSAPRARPRASRRAKPPTKAKKAQARHRRRRSAPYMPPRSAFDLPIPR